MTTKKIDDRFPLRGLKTEELYDWLEDIAKQNGWSMNQAILQILKRVKEQDTRFVVRWPDSN